MLYLLHFPKRKNSEIEEEKQNGLGQFKGKMKYRDCQQRTVITLVGKVAYT